MDGPLKSVINRQNMISSGHQVRKSDQTKGLAIREPVIEVVDFRKVQVAEEPPIIITDDESSDDGFIEIKAVDAENNEPKTLVAAAEVNVTTSARSRASPAKTSTPPKAGSSASSAVSGPSTSSTSKPVNSVQQRLHDLWKKKRETQGLSTMDDPKLSQKTVVEMEKLPRAKVLAIAEKQSSEYATAIKSIKPIEEIEITDDEDVIEAQLTEEETENFDLDFDEPHSKTKSPSTKVNEAPTTIAKITSLKRQNSNDSLLEKNLKKLRLASEEGLKPCVTYTVRKISVDEKLRDVKSIRNDSSSEPSPGLMTDDDSSDEQAPKKAFSPVTTNPKLSLDTKPSTAMSSSKSSSSTNSAVPLAKKSVTASSHLHGIAALLKSKRVIKKDAAAGGRAVITVSQKPKPGRPTFDQTEVDILKIIENKRDQHSSKTDRVAHRHQPVATTSTQARPQESSTRPLPVSRPQPSSKPRPQGSRTALVQPVQRDRVGPSVPSNMSGVSKLKDHVRACEEGKPKPRPVRPPVDRKISLDPYIADVCNWECKWFKNFRDTPEEPPVVPDRAFKPLKNSYETIEEYINVNVPYIYSEIWANLMESYINVKNTNSMGPKSCVLNNYEATGSFIVMGLQTAVPKAELNSQNFFVEGDVVVAAMDLDGIPEEEGATATQLLTLGYITDISLEPINNAMRSLLTRSFAVPQSHDMLARITCRMKKRNIRINNLKPVKLQKLCYVKPQLRLIESLVALKWSYLRESIVKPKKMTCQMAVPTVGHQQVAEYNESQNKAILGSLEAVSRPPSIAKILLIQGPPGTGKTHTLIGIVKTIFARSQEKVNLPKILICAPSNGAVDEIAKRLYGVRNFLRETAGRALRIVRSGQPNQINEELHFIVLDNLVEKNVREMDANHANNFELRSSKVEEQIAAVDQKISNYRAMNKTTKEIEELEQEMIKLTKDLDRMKKQKDVNAPTDINWEVRKRNMRDEILRKSDVVLTTLNSCRSAAIENVFQNDSNGVHFNCVIVDEASQCSEPELLMPLFYTSLSKMILIGDPMQLPATIKSRRANAIGYGKSLFERFFDAFGGYGDKDNPVLMLDEQYRMHKEICSFPAKRFYDNRLRSHLSAGVHENFPLRPYTIIDVQNTVQNTSDPKNIFNQEEAMFVLNVCRVLSTTLKPNASVGIITPYQGQKRLLQKYFSKANLSMNFDVNTIDGFQGQEKDVIILSCVRAAENGHLAGIGFLGSEKRLNVALTRARYALVACVSKPSLDSNSLWKDFLEDAKRRSHFFTMPAKSNPQLISKLLVPKSV